MANFAAPSFSFSLGLDLDEDPVPDPGGSHPIPATDAVERGKEKQVVVEKEDEDVDFGPSPHLPVPVLKRLKRGLRDQGAAAPSTSGSLGFNCFDDDIEEFSSQEDSPIRDVPSSKQNHSVFGSKLSLHGRRILTTQSAGKLKPLNSTLSSSATLTIDPEINNNKMMLPKLTISPLQKIQFMESATDHPSPYKEMKKDNKDNINRKDNGENDSYQKERWHNHTESATQGQSRETNILPVRSSTGSLREDFCSKKSVKFSMLPSNSTPSSNAVLINPEINSNKKILPKLTISPLRKFQLLDSDTDDPSPCKEMKESNKEINSTQSSNAVLVINPETNSNNKMLPKLSISPLRRIQFLDSDTDEPSPCKERKEDNKGNEDSKDTKDNTERKSYQKERWYIHTETATQGQMTKTKVLSHKNPTESLGKDFCSKKSVNFATPALDEFCKEYFSSLEGSSAGQSKEDTISISNLTIQKGNCPVMFPYLSNSSVQEPDYYIEGHDYHPKDGILNNAEHQWSLPDPQPPAYQYFFHDDARIRKLVRERFVNFVPLGTQPHGANQHCEAEFVDYMYQFGPRGAFIQASGARDSAPTKSSRKKKKNQINSNAEETILPSGDWVNPRSCMSHPQSSGTKRGRGGGQSCGRWYTQDGRKVYVTKSGQELSGRVAYQHYYKESGQKPKKKLVRAPRKGKAKR